MAVRYAWFASRSQMLRGLVTVRVEEKVPDHLYHYRSIAGDRTVGDPKIEEAVRILETPWLHFSDPRTYADISDCRIELDFSLSTSEREAYWRHHLERHVVDPEERARMLRHLLETDYLRSNEPRRNARSAEVDEP